MLNAPTIYSFSTAVENAGVNAERRVIDLSNAERSFKAAVSLLLLLRARREKGRETSGESKILEMREQWFQVPVPVGRRWPLIVKASAYL